MISEIEEENYKTVYKLGNLINDNFSRVYDLKYENNDNKKIFIYKFNEEVVAFIQIVNIVDEIEIINIVVDINFRKMKIASNLLEFIIKKYNKKIFLEVNTNNFEAMLLYKKYNFKIINIRKKYYNYIEDAYIMERGI